MYYIYQVKQIPSCHTGWYLELKIYSLIYQSYILYLFNMFGYLKHLLHKNNLTLLNNILVNKQSMDYNEKRILDTFVQNGLRANNMTLCA